VRHAGLSESTERQDALRHRSLVTDRDNLGVRKHRAPKGAL